ncbi:MAG: hypothetical protein K9N35_03100 [Candidatus Marinimicrobia bacterium]|nr:hypothetical protein [Candidatus Neomarinimicrobiota bacterium]
MLFHVFFLMSNSIIAQEFFSLLDDVFEQSNVTRLSLKDLQQTQLKLSTEYAYQDYYRESKPVVGNQMLSGNNNGLSMMGTNARGHLKYGFITWIQGQSQHFSNLDADLDVNADYLRTTSSVHLQIALATEKLLWGLGMEQQQKSLDAQILINAYPTSDDLQMNRYFLDWLEPSFGNQLDIQGEFDLMAFQTYSTITLWTNLLVKLNYSQSDQIFSPNMDYLNDSNIPELQGNRRMLFNGVYGRQCLGISLERPAWLLIPQIKLHNAHADLNILNTLPEIIIDDFHEYGWLELDRKGASIGFGALLRDLNLEAGIGYSLWDATADLETPVLGRYWFFPISHAAQVSISGKSISQHLNLRRDLANGNFGVGLHGGYQHTYFDLTVKGEAELEFNIRSVPIDAPYQFHLHAISVGFPMSYTFKTFSLVYEFNQTMPWYKRVDDSDLKLQGEGTHPDKEIRGGGEHAFTFSWTLR